MLDSTHIDDAAQNLRRHFLLNGCDDIVCDVARELDPSHGIIVFMSETSSHSDVLKLADLSHQLDVPHTIKYEWC